MAMLSMTIASLGLGMSSVEKKYRNIPAHSSANPTQPPMRKMLFFLISYLVCVPKSYPIFRISFRCHLLYLLMSPQ